jgi:hypothetical protein
MKNPLYLTAKFLCAASLPLLFSCGNQPSETLEDKDSAPASLFSPVNSDHSGIDFANNITETKAFNYLRYSYMYNGGGVAAGDINGDDLPDLFFTANQLPNKLYLNKGNFQFEDITDSAGIIHNEGWTTGVAMADINGDGYTDIYVCRSGPFSNPEMRRNELYMNQGDGTFKESAAEWNVNDQAHSTMAYFFDYDLDGDLDFYLVNHRVDFLDNIVVDLGFQAIIDPVTTDRLYRNDGNHFTDVSQTAGIENKAWGLGAAIADYNNDQLPDIYVCNDYRQPDHLWLNNGDGTFSDGILEHFGHISFYSMGADAADFNNDGLIDLAVLDMVSEDHVRSKRMMASMNPAAFNEMVSIGYHHQYMFNMLHLNRGNGDFSEIGQLAGISKTDWSWAPLFADFDLDGHQDLFITNGMQKDVTDVDFKMEIERRFEMGQPMSFEEAMERWPAAKIPNYAFRNTGDFRFENASAAWGTDQPVNSNGAVYTDLNRDGKPDLVLNNLNEPASIYRNNAGGNHLVVQLKGNSSNTHGVGARVEITSAGKKQVREIYPCRGFQSSVGPELYFGLGDEEEIEMLEVRWPSGQTEIREKIRANQLLVLNEGDARAKLPETKPEPWFSSTDASELGIDFVHKENEFNDFAREVLLPHKLSTLGPAIAVGDLNGDGLDDFFVGNATGSESATFVQTPEGRFKRTNQIIWKKDAQFEDLGALFFDANGDGHQDLYVVSGGNEHAIDDPLLQDRLYINDGKGTLSKVVSALPQMPSSGQKVIASDMDGDGDQDLFVGGRQHPGIYPFPGRSYLLRNNQGVFEDATDELVPELKHLGMITDACFADYDGDGLTDLFVVGEWAPLMCFKNQGGRFVFDRTTKGLEQSNAWWYSIHAADIDRDGDLDFIAGNLGENNKFKPNPEKPLHVFCNDFDGNGTYDIVLSKQNESRFLPVRGRECSSEQMPFISRKFPSFRSFAEADLSEIYGSQALQQSLHYVAYDFSSVYLENLSGGTFKKHRLPAEAQFGPVMSMISGDFNDNGKLNILGVGNIFDSEPETIRYDACRGFVLEVNEQGQPEAINESGFYHFTDAKALAEIRINGRRHFIVASNSDSLRVLVSRKEVQ